MLPCFRTLYSGISVYLFSSATLLLSLCFSLTLSQSIFSFQSTSLRGHIDFTSTTFSLISIKVGYWPQTAVKTKYDDFKCFCICIHSSTGTFSVNILTHLHVGLISVTNNNKQNSQCPLKKVINNIMTLFEQRLGNGSALKPKIFQHFARTLLSTSGSQ